MEIIKEVLSSIYKGQKKTTAIKSLTLGLRTTAAEQMTTTILGSNINIQRAPHGDLHAELYRDVIQMNVNKCTFIFLRNSIEMAHPGFHS